MDREQMSSEDMQHDRRPAPSGPADARPWWQRFWGAVLMLAAAALLMGAALTVWGESGGL